jgi:hypothetical protein
VIIVLILLMISELVSAYCFIVTLYSLQWFWMRHDGLLQINSKVTTCTIDTMSVVLLDEGRNINPLEIVAWCGNYEFLCFALNIGRGAWMLSSERRERPYNSILKYMLCFSYLKVLAYIYKQPHIYKFILSL